uniref:V-type proton ATPase subunit d n=1 Tax=Cacopsylla melanoneura TaxID=428564 RepID=A0A8D8ZR93_9HEMI
MDFITYSYMIDNIILLITGTLHQRPIPELIPKCHPLGSFEQMEAIHVAATPAELYNAARSTTGKSARRRFAATPPSWWVRKFSRSRVPPQQFTVRTTEWYTPCTIHRKPKGQVLPLNSQLLSPTKRNSPTPVKFNDELRHFKLSAGIMELFSTSRAV